MKKRICSTLLALCMVLALLPGTAGADIAFDHLPATKTVATPDGWTIEYVASEEFQHLYHNYPSNCVIICHVEGDSSHIDIPAQIDGKPVIALLALGSFVEGGAKTTFGDCPRLNSVTIPSGVISIGPSTFRDCTGLTSVDIPNSVTSIELYAFDGCTSLASINIPNSVTSIEIAAFLGCTSLTSIDIPNSVTAIGDLAFDQCTALTRITIPDSVAYIGSSAFYGCTSLTSVTIPNSVTSIENNTFYGCTSLTSIDIPSSVTSIEYWAFHGCTSLSSVTIPDSVAEIGNNVFYECKSLTSITIPGSVTTLGNGIFMCCTGLTNVTIEKGVAGISEDTFSSCRSLQTITIPKSVAHIDRFAFSSCPALTTVTYGGSEEDRNANIQIDNAGNVNQDLLNANWIYTDEPDEPAGSTACQITFDPTGGTLTGPAVMTTGTDGKLPSLPAATRTGYTFNGWYTALTGGTEVTIETVFDANTTLYAQWTGGGSSGETYQISSPSSVMGGAILVSPTSARKGETVTITLTPDSGYTLKELVVIDAGGNRIQTTGAGGDKYTFVMPEGAVKVAAGFASAAQPEPTPKPTPEPVPAPAPESAPDPIPEPTPVWTNPFKDVAATSWYYDAVKYVSENALINGIGNNQFAPNANLTRAQLAQILYNKEGKPAVSGSSGFTDVTAGSWYADAVIWAAANNIIGGYGNGQFGPNDSVTREQLVTMLWRFKGSPYGSGDLTQFTDGAAVSPYAADAAAWAVSGGLLKGDNGALNPQGTATRAEVAAILQRFCQIYA